MAKKVIKMVVPGYMTYCYDAKTGKYIKGKDAFEEGDDEELQFTDENGKYIELSEEMQEKIFNNE